MCSVSDQAVPGQTNLVVCVDAPHVVSQISGYLDIKSQRPDTTDAFVICPRLANAPWQTLTKRMVLLTVAKLSKLCVSYIDPEADVLCQVFYDPCRARSGLLPVDKLPNSMQVLCAQSIPQNGLTFVFDARVSGLPCTALWDTGAATSFISEDYASTIFTPRQPTQPYNWRTVQ